MLLYWPWLVSIIRGLLRRPEIVWSRDYCHSVEKCCGTTDTSLALAACLAVTFRPPWLPAEKVLRPSLVTWVGTMQRKEGSCVSPWQLGCLSCNTSATLWVSAPGLTLPFPLPSAWVQSQKCFTTLGQIFAEASRFVAKISAYSELFKQVRQLL